MRMSLAVAFISFAVPASALTVNVTGGFDGNIIGIDHYGNVVVDLAPDDPALEGWYLEEMLTNTGSMDLKEREIDFGVPEVFASNCTGILYALCTYNAYSYDASLANWDYILDECGDVPCAIEFSLRGYKLDGDADTGWSNSTGIYGYVFDRLFVRFDSVTIEYDSPPEVPLPGSAALILSSFLLLTNIRRRHA